MQPLSSAFLPTVLGLLLASPLQAQPAPSTSAAPVPDSPASAAPIPTPIVPQPADPQPIAPKPAVPQPTVEARSETSDLCDRPVLQRLSQHRVTAGETLGSIAQRYNLTIQTLQGLNPSSRSGGVRPGEVLRIPAYNGFAIAVPSGSTWPLLARQYGVRADLLFEMNGCQTPQSQAWVPYIPTDGSLGNPTNPPAPTTILVQYPLRQRSDVLLGYGWQLQPANGNTSFHGGLDLAAKLGDAVLAVGAGTVAYAAPQGDYGTLVVINHAQGLQSRYAQLQATSLTVGQGVKAGQVIGQVGNSGKPSVAAPHLHFEIRLNSSVGWVAQDPVGYLRGGLGTVGTR